MALSIFNEGTLIRCCPEIAADVIVLCPHVRYSTVRAVGNTVGPTSILVDRDWSGWFHCSSFLAFGKASVCTGSLQ
jgi:hypothetical protein